MDGHVKVSLQDLRASAHLTTDYYQYELRWLHGFLKQLRKDILRTKTSAVSSSATQISARMCADRRVLPVHPIASRPEKISSDTSLEPL